MSFSWTLYLATIFKRASFSLATTWGRSGRGEEEEVHGIGLGKESCNIYRVGPDEGRGQAHPTFLCMFCRAGSHLVVLLRVVLRGLGTDLAGELPQDTLLLLQNNGYIKKEG